MGYTGTSIVDYLKSIGQSSDYASREKLAAQKGLTGYIGSGPQNEQLLGLLRAPAPVAPVNAGSTPAVAPTPTQPIPAPVVPTPVTPAPASQPVAQSTPESDPSIVNYLSSLGQASDYNTRAKLAQERGISGYTGSGPQNTRLLDMLRAEETAAQQPKQESKPVVPQVNPQGPTVNAEAEKAKINADANKLAQEELARIQAQTSKVDLSKSAGLVENLLKTLETKKAETPVSLEQKFAEERQKIGVGDLETSLTKADADLKKFDADFASTTEGEEGRQVSMSQIRRRQSAEELAYNKKRREMVVERDSIANQLNMKYGVVNSIMKFAGEDYDNARQTYQNQLNSSIQMINLVKGIEDSAKTDQERKSDNARANLTIWSNLFKGGNVSYDSLDESTKLDIKNAEIQAGFPVGFSKFVHETIDEPVTSYLPAYTDAAGNRIQPVGTINKETGAFTIKNVTLPGGTQDTSGASGDGGSKKTEAEVIRAARSDMAAQLNARKDKDGYVSPADYKIARDAWISKGGYESDEFYKSFKSYVNPKTYAQYGISATEWFK